MQLLHLYVDVDKWLGIDGIETCWDLSVCTPYLWRRLWSY